MKKERGAHKSVGGNRDPPTARDAVISIAGAMEAGSIRLPRHEKKEGRTEVRPSFFLVEAAGIEPASEKPLTELSPGAGHLLNFPGLAADARAA